MTRGLVVGTRRSRLAQLQTEQVLLSLHTAWPDLEVRTRLIESRGDQHIGPLYQTGAGAFTSALEDALLAKEIDFAVHSLKDLPSTLCDGLVLGAVPTRSSPRDTMVTQAGFQLDTLPVGARVGTGSRRRKAQLRAVRPDLNLVGLRGNVDTRLERVKSGALEAIVVAEAGLVRLGAMDAQCRVIPTDVMLPAPGQGALGVECREGDSEVRELLSAIECEDACRATTAERAFLAALGSGCAAPVGALATFRGLDLYLDAAVFAPDGSKSIRIQGDGRDPESLGRSVAEEARGRGAAGLLDHG